MFKFSKNEDLLATIDKQKEQLKRYESRLRDVVQAYKSLQNEKDALENSMKALTAAVPSAISGKPLKESKKYEKSYGFSSNTLKYEEHLAKQNIEEVSDQEQDEKSAIETAGLESVEGTSSSRDDTDQDREVIHVQHLRSQVYTLTQSLSTMTAEKSKMVATYQAEKRKLKQEQELQIKSLQEENEVFYKKTSLLEEELTQLKEKIRNEQVDREQEQATHSIMLREIQRMLNDERIKNESNESLIKELRSAAQNASIEAQEDYKRRVRQLEDELEKVRRRMLSAEEESNKPSPLLIQLREEMEEMKLSHQTQLEKEQARVLEMEQRERDIAHAEEERVSDLENRLIQISSKMGLYDGKMQKDQISIQHLKDRISQLDIENTLLTKQIEAAKTQQKQLGTISMKLKMEDEDLDIDSLKEKIVNYKRLLKEAASKSNEPVDLSDVLSSLESDSEDYRKLYLESQQNLLHLKEEHERYKTRAQNVLKNIKEGRSSSGGDPEEIKRQLAEMRERHFHLRSRCDDLEAKCANMKVDHQHEIEKLALVHKTELERNDETRLRQISDKEREMRNQRERTIALLADKDKEIKQLKAYTSVYQGEYHFSASSSTNRHLSDREPLDSAEDTFEELLRQPGQDKNIIHYAEQLARKDITINNLRRHKKQLELQVRQLQDDSLTKDENYAQEVAILKEKVLEFERGSLRKNANMEYLKNVFYRYLTTSDYAARQKMLVALVTILQFSPEENRKVGVKR